MKIKFARQAWPGQDHVVLQTEHGLDNSSLYTKHVTVGEVIEVDDELGYKLLSRYTGLLEMLMEDKVLKVVAQKK
jgi:hypothetical protein